MSEAVHPAADGAAPRGLGRGFTPGRPSLVAYIMAGYPDRPTSLACLHAVAAAGADVIELGVPYSDPLADGAVIAKAGREAISAAEGGFGLRESIALAAEFRAGAGDASAAPPVALMTYLNPMLRLGLPDVARAAADAGISAFIVPDMPPDSRMAAQWLDVARSAGLDTVFLVAPTSTDDRIALAAGASSGFVYCVSSVGVTGERPKLAEGLSGLIDRVRAASGGTPVAVGFGISSVEQAAEVGRIADGVVVGSAIVRRQGDPAGAGEFVGHLRRALDEAARSPRSGASRSIG